MRKRNEWNTDGLQRHAEKLRGETETKVNDIIDEMKRKHKVINFKTVAEASGVSRATLYENEKLRRRIESLRAVKTTKASDPGVEHQRRTQEKDLRRQIKVLKEEYSSDAGFVAKFRREAQAAGGLSHPNIVSVYDVGEENGVYFIVMELVDGITLKDYIVKKGKTVGSL